MGASRSSALGVLAAVAFVLIGVWGVVNLSDGDWLIGGAMLASAVIGLWSRAVRMLQEPAGRAERRRHVPEPPEG